MIDIKALENTNKNPESGKTYFEEYKQSLINRGASASDLDGILSLNQKRKALIAQMEATKAEQNKFGPQIAKMKKNKEDASELLAEMQKLAGKAKEMEPALSAVEDELRHKLLVIPNKVHPSIPVGKSEVDNKEVRQKGEIPKFNFKPKEHFELGEKLGILDFERATKIAGARFSILRAAGAQLERALVQFKMDLHSKEHGYEETIPPFIVNSQSLLGTGQFPKFQEDVFHLAGTDYHLIPTSEVPVTNYYAEEILDEKELPKRFVSFSPCFRSEAGSHGKDTRGLIRQHQFNKVELMVFAHPEKSYEEHERMVKNAERVLDLLEIPYRTMMLCTGDIGFGAAKCYDIEVWLPGQNAFREISSISNCEDFQARRANIRFRPEGPKAKPQFVHTLNGSGLAVGRTWIAVLENYQQEDGSIKIPSVLRPYMGGADSIGFAK